MIDICKGCNYPSTGRICIFNDLKYQDLCPCIECLVKMICTTQPNCDVRCKVLKEFINGITQGQPGAYRRGLNV